MTDYNSEKKRLLRCPGCKVEIIDFKPGMICPNCKCNLITVITENKSSEETFTRFKK